jgi:nucleoside-diphosphate-sugar epimerase
VATLVTGLGYIGSALARRLLKDGEEVVAIESFFSSPREPAAALAATGPFTLVEGSITDPAVVERAFRAARIATVFHSAAQASAHPGAASMAFTEETNFTGPRVLLDACVAHGVERVVLASSTRLYRPLLPRVLSERAPINATDLVHLSHRYGEVLLGLYHRHHGLRGMGARMGIVHGVGPVMKTDPWFLPVPQRFCLDAARGLPLKVATGPETLLAFVHLDDAIEGLLRCRDLPADVSLANVAAEVRTVASVAEAVREAARQRGLSVQMRFTGRPRVYAPRRVVSALDGTGFEPTRRIEDSVGEVLDYYCRGEGI